MREYLKNPLGCRREIQVLSREEQMEEFLFLGLRMTEGIYAEEFRNCFDVTLESVYGSVIEKNMKDGLLTWESTDKRRLFLTEKGLDLSNYVMAQFLLT